MKIVRDKANTDEFGIKYEKIVDVVEKLLKLF